MCINNNFRLVAISLYCFFISCTTVSYSQEIEDLSDLNSRQKWNLAESYLFEEDFLEANSIYHSLFKKDPTNHHLAYKIGYTHLINEENQNVELAIEFLILATENISKRHRGRFREKSAPLNAYYYLGAAFRLNEQYEEAIDALLTYKNSLTRREAKTVKGQFVDREIQSNRDAMELIEFEHIIVEEIIVDGLEDPYIKCPILCHDADKLIFTNGKFNTFPPDINYNREHSEGPFDQVYIANRNSDGNFHSPKNISKYFEIDFPYIPVTATADCSELYLIVDVGDRGQIYLSRFVDGQYQKAEPVRALNSRGWESHASITPDGSRIYFTSDRRGGYGGLDIWFSDRNEDGEWQKPINIGPEINTEFHEEMPYISKNGNQLFFSSEGHLNIGGFDVFSSFYDVDNEKWRTPTNLGYPFNTIGNDMGYIIENPPHFTFCPVNDNRRRFGVEGCQCMSITKRAAPQLADVIGKVSIEDSEIQLPMDTRLRVVLVKSDQTEHDVLIDSDGTYLVEGVSPGSYNMVVYVDDEVLASRHLLVPISNEGLVEDIDITIVQSDYIKDYLAQFVDEILDDIEEVIADTDIAADTADDIAEDVAEVIHDETLSDETKDEIIYFSDLESVKTILFDNNSAEVKSDYLDDLKAVGEFLKNNPNSIIELNGFCSQTGSKEYNLVLGKERASSVKREIVKFGADKSQVKLVSHGKDNPIAIGNYIDSRVYNKRVEVHNVQNAEKIKNIQVFVPGYYRVENQNYNYCDGTFFISEKKVFNAVVFESVLFGFDKYSINNIHTNNLNIIADYLIKYPNAKVAVIGHTDHYGSASYNIGLSERRAREVKRYLLNKGVNTSQVEVKWKGETEQITTKTDYDTIRRLNRRVEIEILRQGEEPAVVAPIFVPSGYLLR